MLISRSDSIAANSRSANVLQGEQFEFVPKHNATINFRASGAAVGLRADFQIGSQTVMGNAAVPGTNRFPVIPDDHLATFGANRSERLFLTYTNTTGAAIIVNTVIEIL